MGYTMDTHTAVAYHAGRQYVKETGDDTQQIVISTASPYKFAEDVLRALKVDWDSGDDDSDMAAVQALSTASGLPIPEAVSQLANKPVRHTTICAVKDMEQAVRRRVGAATCRS